MSELGHFAEIIAGVSPSELEADPTLGGRLLLSALRDLKVCYAPFDHIQTSAKLVLVGITPGAQQARNAFIALQRELAAGADHRSALKAAKAFASFSGPM